MPAETVSGVVRSGKQPIPGATVIAKQGESVVSSVTDENGRYQLDNLSSGDWNVEVRMFGFQPIRKTLTATSGTADWSLVLGARPSGGPGQGAGNGFQRLNLAAVNGQQELTGLNTPPPPDTGGAEGSSTESFLVNGSVSRGLQAPADDGGPVPGGDFGMMGQGLGQQPGQGFGQNGPGGGFGGRGGFGGGPGGGFGGRGGFGGPGGRGGPGNRQGMRGRGGVPAAFGNRQGRQGQMGIRGSLFYQIADSSFNARPVSLTGNLAPNPSYNQNRFGANFGGPLKIPHLLKGDQTFFFLNYTGVIGSQPYSGFGTVPTAAERAGDFSQAFNNTPVTIFDPLTNQPFPNNQIPASRLNPASVGLLKFIPLPSSAGLVQNYQFITSVPNDNHNLNVRFNQGLTQKDRLSVGFGYQHRDSHNAQLYGFEDIGSGQGLNIDLGWTHTFGRQTISNAHATFNRNSNETLPYFAYSENIAAELGIIGTSSSPINYGPPNLNFTNFGSLNDASALFRHSQTFGLSESMLLVRGAHSMTFGGEWKRIDINAVTDQNGRGTFLFSGLATSGFDATGQPIAGTGFDFADFLLGRPESSSIRYGSSDTYFRGGSYAMFAQDEWRARPNLTFTLGLRYEYFQPFTEKYGRLANLDIAGAFTGAAVVTPNQPGPYSGQFPASLVNPDRNNLSPRVAFAWRPFAKSRFQVRGGYGLYYDSSVYNNFVSQLASQPPFGNAANLVSSADTPLTIQNGFVDVRTKQITNTYAVDRTYRTPYAQTVNFSIQHELPHGFVVETGYLMTKGTRLDILRLPNRAAPGSPLTAEQRRQIGNATGFTYDSSEGDSIYHAAQLRVLRRLRRGVSFQTLYTFSKSIDNASSIGGVGNLVAQNDRDLRAERGLSTFDQRHAVTASTLLTSPFGDAAYWLRGPGLLSTLLRDWTASTSLTYHSGHPFTARVLGNVADAGGTGAVGSARANATGLPLYLDNGALNPLAFSVPLPGEFGNAGRNTIIGPSFLSLNASFGRSFKVGNSERRRLEFRVEANNIANHVNITSIATVVNASNFGLANVAGPMRTVDAVVRFRF